MLGSTILKTLSDQSDDSLGTLGRQQSVNVDLALPATPTKLMSFSDKLT